MCNRDSCSNGCRRRGGAERLAIAAGQSKGTGGTSAPCLSLPETPANSESGAYGAAINCLNFGLFMTGAQNGLTRSAARVTKG